jgi:hypothetical protein
MIRTKVFICQNSTCKRYNRKQEIFWDDRKEVPACECCNASGETLLEDKTIIINVPKHISWSTWQI